MKTSLCLVLALAASCLALISRWPDFAVTGLNNLASLALVEAWQPIAANVAIPVCQPHGLNTDIGNLLDQGLRLNPQHQRVVSNYARLNWLQGHCADAVALWEQLIETGEPLAIVGTLWSGKFDRVPMAFIPNLAEYAFLHAMFAQEQKEDEAAFAWYGLAHRLQPRFRTAERLGDMYVARRQPLEAARAWEATAEALPTVNKDHWWALGQAAELRGSWLDAAQAYGQGARVSREPYEFLLRQGYAYVRAQKNQEAQRIYQNALALRPDLPAAYIDLARLYFSEQAPDKGLSRCAQAQAVAPEDVEAMFCSGYANYLMRDYIQALPSLELAFLKKSNDSWMAFVLAQTLHHLGDQTRATEILAQAIAASPERLWQWMLILGDWRYEIGDELGAQEAYRVAREWGAPEERMPPFIRQEHRNE